MKHSHLSLAVVVSMAAVVGFTFWQTGQIHEPVLVEEHSEASVYQTTSADLPWVGISPERSKARQTASVDISPRRNPFAETGHDHGNHQPVTDIQLAELPADIQQGIQNLHSGDNRDVEVTQVSPTVFRADLKNVHRTVPVAVIQPDGDVVIAEY